MDIRTVRPDEWRRLKSIRLRALETDPDAFGSSLAEERAEPDATWRTWAGDGWGLGAQITLVAVQGDRWLGMGVCVMSEAEPRSAAVYAMWVDPVARRQGVGQELLETLTDWASSRGAEELLLTVTEGNTGAVSLYERAGFQGTGEQDALRPGATLRKLSMRKSL